jgi:3'-phosphoadenosine 5'-phosphosulfate (PAPS) 3'-phosphatase
MKFLRSLTCQALLALASLGGAFRCHALQPSLQIGPLLSTCIDACQRGCDEIRYVQAGRQQEEPDGDDDNNTFQVALKDATDPRSALTQADLAAQQAIIGSLRAAWVDSLHIVGEEDDAHVGETTLSKTYTEPLRMDLLEDDIGETEALDPSRVTIFVDPLDGTREFVEGRLAHCQVLIGIAMDGEAVAGVVGIPFPAGHNMTTAATIVYGLDGLGTGTRGTPLTRGPWPLDRHIDGVKYPRPHYASGDFPSQGVASALQALKNSFGGSPVVYGGVGNRVLAAALGEVSCSLAHKVGGPWDLCAPQALAQAMGARVTDVFGDPIDMYRPDSAPRNNERGFLVTPPGSNHQRVLAIVKSSAGVQAYKKSLPSIR